MYQIILLALLSSLAPVTWAQETSVQQPMQAQQRAQTLEPKVEQQPMPVWRHYNQNRYDNQPLDRSYTPPPENPHPWATVPLAQLQLLATLPEPIPRALLRGPEGKPQRVRMGQQLGQEGARVVAIEAQQLQLVSAQNQPLPPLFLTPLPENQAECRYSTLAVRGQLSHTQAQAVINPNFPALCQLWRFAQTERPQLADRWELALSITPQGRIYKPLAHIASLTPTRNNAWSLLDSEWQQLLATWQFPPLPEEQTLYFTLHFQPKSAAQPALADPAQSATVK